MNEFNYKRLEDLCFARGYTINSLAKAVGGVRESSIRFWKQGSKPRPSNVKPIADFFGVPVSYFFEDGDAPVTAPVGDLITLRVVASVKAGYDGLMNEEYFSEQEQVPVSMLRGYPAAECRLYTVRGDSMFPRILDGDKIIVHVQPSVDSGDIAIIVVNGDEGTVKRVEYRPNEDWLDLVPANPEYQRKHIEGADLEQCHVYGKVIGLLRSI